MGMGMAVRRRHALALLSLWTRCALVHGGSAASYRGVRV